MRAAWMVALAALGALAALACAAAQNDACARLGKRFESQAGAGRARSVRAYGAARTLLVWPRAGEGAAGLALAAMLAAALRHNGYGDVHLHKPHPGYRFVIIVHPNDEFLQSPRLQMRPGPGCAPAATSWPPSAAPTAPTGRTAPAASSQCSFLTVADLSSARSLCVATGEAGAAGAAGAAGECMRSAVVVAPERLALAAGELERRAACGTMRLRVIKEEPLVKLVARLNRSLLFFDRPLEIYDSYIRVVPEPPYCNDDTRSQRRDESNLRIPISTNDITARIYRFAPHIERVVANFAPSAADLRKVLADIPKYDGNIAESACDWALTELRETDRPSEDRVDLSIRLLLCRDDPDRDEYESMCKAVFGNTSMSDVTTSRPTTVAAITIEYKTINCSRGDVIGDELFFAKGEWNEQHVAGWMALSASADTALKAQEIARPLLAYGAPPDGLRPNSVVRAVAGSARLLALAYLHLLRECGVRRLAVLSDRTALADELTDVIRDGSIVIRQRNVTSSESIEDALREFGEADVSAYFVNADATVSAEVICAAQRLRVTAAEEQLWLVREWRAAGRCGPGALQPMALGVAWRGAAGAEWWLTGGAGDVVGARKAALEALEARWPDRAWPPLAAPILDGLRLLNRTVADFVSSHPDSIYDRYIFGNVENFDTAINATKFQGMIQEVVYNSSTNEVASALVFVERWSGARRDLLAVWRADAAGVRPLRRAPFAPRWCPRAAPRCHTTRSGDAFAPRCHDTIWGLCLAVAVLTPLALTYARRARLRRLKLRDLALFEQLQEQRKNNSSKFSSNLVSRNQFELREELGFGAYGRVSVAVLRRPGAPPHAVAAKEPAMERLQDEAELIREADVLASLHHENIIRFEGVCLDGRAVFFMEYAFFGDLRHYLRARRPLVVSASIETEVGAEAEATEAAHVSAAALTRLARQAAEALCYLEARRIVHRDIRAANCLVDETRNLKLADFGLARYLAGEEEEYIWQNLRRLPAACMAPESLLSGVFSAASDVWALGVLMLELVTLGEPPYGARSTADIVAGLRTGDHPPLPAAASPDTCHLLQWCWQRCPGKRPGAAQVRDALQQNGAALAPALRRAPLAPSANPTPT